MSSVSDQAAKNICSVTLVQCRREKTTPLTRAAEIAGVKGHEFIRLCDRQRFNSTALTTLKQHYSRRQHNNGNQQEA
jgi:hypothetical protein